MEAGRLLNASACAARDVAVRLLAEAGASDGSPAGVVAQAGGAVLQRMEHGLAHWFGAYGFHALLSRALDRSREVCPALDAVCVPPGREDGHSISLDTFSALISLPSEVVMDACTTSIAEIIALLGRLVGDDMAWRLMEHSWLGEASESNPPSP